MQDQLLKVDKVAEIVALSKSRIYELCHEDKFPRPIKMGRSSLWKLSTIQTWIAGLEGDRPRNQ
jgi:prophage regulatory protein